MRSRSFRLTTSFLLDNFSFAMLAYSLFETLACFTDTISHNTIFPEGFSAFRFEVTVLMLYLFLLDFLCLIPQFQSPTVALLMLISFLMFQMEIHKVIWFRFCFF